MTGGRRVAGEAVAGEGLGFPAGREVEALVAAALEVAALVATRAVGHSVGRLRLLALVAAAVAWG